MPIIVDRHASVLRAQARRFIGENPAAALATSDLAGMPHVATVYCVAHEDLSLYCSTRVEGRKFKNMTERPQVAVAFTNEARLCTIQLTGSAERIENIRLEQEILHQLMTIRYHDPYWPIPSMQLFERGVTNELAILKITPLEMTYANFENPTLHNVKSFFQKVI